MLLDTGSVLPNSLKDFAGYIRFIENYDNLWQEDNFNQWGLDKNSNPHILAGNHQGAGLRLPTRAVERFITSSISKPATTGDYLSKVWSQCMVRRTYAHLIHMKILPRRAILLLHDTLADSQLRSAMMSMPGTKQFLSMQSDS